MRFQSRLKAIRYYIEKNPGLEKGMGVVMLGSLIGAGYLASRKTDDLGAIAVSGLVGSLLGWGAFAFGVYKTNKEKIDEIAKGFEEGVALLPGKQGGK